MFELSNRNMNRTGPKYDPFVWNWTEKRLFKPYVYVYDRSRLPKEYKFAVGYPEPIVKNGNKYNSVGGRDIHKLLD